MPPSYSSTSSNAFRDFNCDPVHQSYTNLSMNQEEQSVKEFLKMTDSADSQTVSILKAAKSLSGIQSIY